MIRQLLKKVEHRLAKRSSQTYCAYLRKHGIQLGENTILHPESCNIDLTRPSLVSIGSNCLLNEHFTLLTHDYVSGVFINCGQQFCNSSGKVSIGNNVGFGHNVTVLKGVTIGDNCFIGAGSVVSKDIPANSIAVGAPCKVIMNLEEYHQKRKTMCEREALEYARSIQEHFNRRPIPADFWEEFIWFVSGKDIDNYPEIPIRKQLGPTYEYYKKNHIAKYKDFDAFLDAAGIK